MAAPLARPQPSLPALALAAFREAALCGRLELALPGRGDTWGRLRALARFGEEDLAFARLAEGHADALAILAELDQPSPPPGSLWGVWAAEPPGSVVQATQTPSGWRLDGIKSYCSGASTCSHALITAKAADGRRLFAIDAADGAPVAGSWPAVGMAGSDSLAVALKDAPATAIGGPGAYLTRPGFWHGAVGVAAVWHGGAVGVARTLLHAGPGLDAHGLAHLGAVDATLVGMQCVLRQAAQEIDQDPTNLEGQGALRAGRVRAAVEAGAASVMDHVGRALGAAPLCLDGAHGRRVADLTVYLRQSHAERDLAGLAQGLLARGQDPEW
ncbi:MAG: acyl-CoA dehydrogenase family protein [Actinomycetota bacterium]